MAVGVGALDEDGSRGGEACETGSERRWGWAPGSEDREHRGTGKGVLHREGEGDRGGWGGGGARRRGLRLDLCRDDPRLTPRAAADGGADDDPRGVRLHKRSVRPWSGRQPLSVCWNELEVLVGWWGAQTESQKKKKPLALGRHSPSARPSSRGPAKSAIQANAVSNAEAPLYASAPHRVTLVLCRSGAPRLPPPPLPPPTPPLPTLPPPLNVFFAPRAVPGRSPPRLGSGVGSVTRRPIAVLRASAPTGRRTS